MEFHGTLNQSNIPWNSMEPQCCSNVALKVPWNYGGGSLDIFCHECKLQIVNSFEKRF